MMRLIWESFIAGCPGNANLTGFVSYCAKYRRSVRASANAVPAASGLIGWSSAATRLCLWHTHFAIVSAKDSKSHGSDYRANDETENTKDLDATEEGDEGDECR